jgi:DNA-binding NarL/FixJ family response regulator
MLLTNANPSRRFLSQPRVRDTSWEWLERFMQDGVLQILFLGETSSWERIAKAFAAQNAPLHVHAVDSLPDLFQALALGRWQGLAIDVHAWNFQGLHYVEKVRAEYPAFPVIALFSRSIPELNSKAMICGASGCVAFDELTPSTLHAAVSDALEQAKAQFFLGEEWQGHFPRSNGEVAALTFTKNQVITHALNNLLCIISANVDLLSDCLNGSSDNRPLLEIKKATRSAAALMRHLK